MRRKANTKQKVPAGVEQSESNITKEEAENNLTASTNEELNGTSDGEEFVITDRFNFFVFFFLTNILS